MCKRCFVLVVLTFALSTLLISDTVDCDERKCLKKMRDKLDATYVLIDPGHGGEKTGAKASDGTWEKDLNFKISKLLRDRLIQLGIKNVEFTRKEHQTLRIIKRRVPKIKQFFADAKKNFKGLCRSSLHSRIRPPQPRSSR